MQLNSQPRNILLVSVLAWMLTGGTATAQTLMQVLSQEPQPSPATPSRPKTETQNQPSAPTVVETGTVEAAQPVSTHHNPAFKIVSPSAGDILDIPAAKVILQFPPHSQIELKVNGLSVGDAAVGQTSVDADGTVTKTWYGVSLQAGDNELTAEGYVNGEFQSIRQTISVRGAASQLAVKVLETTVPADGRTRATVQGQLLDDSGNRSNYSAVVTLTSSLGQFVGEDHSDTQPGFQVQAEKGLFSAVLEAPLEAGTARIRAASADLEAYAQLQFQTDSRPGLVSGVLNTRWGKGGLNFYDRFKDFRLDEQGYELDASGALFATGSLGEWLFTGAYNSDRPLNEDCNCNNNLYDAQDQISDFSYPVHGDSSTVNNLTPSLDHFYARIERTPTILGAAPDFALWGDYGTEEFANPSQEFTATTRQLHGAKLNYNFGNLQLTGFFGNNVEGFQRDVIAPDGTSGFYFVSQRLLIPGSENIFLELEELERPGTLIERLQLTRGQDYDIDYDRGTIQFREAILRTAIAGDGRVLVRRIVATYQHDSGESTSIRALRARYHLSRELQQESWIGATALKEDKGDRDFSLYGVDGFFSLGVRGQVVAEYAYSQNDSFVLGQQDGSAYRLEAQGSITDSITGRAYYRHADTGFANNATVSFVPGQTRYGAEMTAAVGTSTSLRLSYDHENNQGVAPRPIITVGDLLAADAEPLPGQRVDNRLTTITAGVQQRLGSTNVDVDLVYRDREDRLNRSRSRSSSQLRSRFTMPLTSKLSVNALNETTLSNSSDAVYSDRTQVGLEYQLLPGINLGLNQHWFTNGQFDGQSFTTLDLTGDYVLFDNTSLTGRYGIVSGLNGMRGQGAIGLKHRWEVTDGLNLDFGYERFVGDLFGQTAAGDRTRQPVLVGANSSTLGVSSGDSFNIGAEYTANPDWKASARYERSNASGGTSTNISAAVTGKISPSLTGLMRFNRSNNGNQGLRNNGPTTEFRLGLAYRDIAEDKLNALLRYEYRRNPSLIPESILLGSGTGSSEHIFAAEAIYAPAWNWELYGKFALRQSESFIAEDLVGSNTTTLAQLRGTYRLYDSLELLGEARWIGQSSGFSETGFVFEAGYYLTPDLRLGVGYVLGRVGDRDFDGSQSNSGPYVDVTLKVNELFGGFGDQEPVPKIPKQNESSQE